MEGSVNYKLSNTLYIERFHYFSTLITILALFLTGYVWRREVVSRLARTCPNLKEIQAEVVVNPVLPKLQKIACVESVRKISYGGRQPKTAGTGIRTKVT
jgi:hypothetical protein